jgi:hypothetical protein
VRLAAQGLRDMDDGPEKIEDDAVLAQVRKQARKVYMESIASASIVTLIFALIPV